MAGALAGTDGEGPPAGKQEEVTGMSLLRRAAEKTEASMQEDFFGLVKTR